MSKLARRREDDLEEATERALQRIKDALRGLAYGQLTIVVHEGRIVQVERTEKFRLERS